MSTRKLTPALSPALARELVMAYAEWPVVEIDSALIVAASVLEQTHSLSFWDALIVGAAHRAGAHRLVTEDMPTGRELLGMVFENPFA